MGLKIQQNKEWKELDSIKILCFVCIFNRDLDNETRTLSKISVSSSSMETHWYVPQHTNVFQHALMSCNLSKHRSLTQYNSNSPLHTNMETDLGAYFNHSLIWCCEKGRIFTELSCNPLVFRSSYLCTDAVKRWKNLLEPLHQHRLVERSITFNLFPSLSS